MRQLLISGLIISLAMAGCVPGGGGISTNDSPNACGEPGCEWPGGTLEGWSENNGTREAWNRSNSPTEDGPTHAPSDGDSRASEPGEHFGGGGASGGFEGGAGGAGGGGFEGGASDAPALEGGEIDDNDDHEAFVAYGETMIGLNPSIHWLDVSSRHYIRVVDGNGRHIPDATVILSSEEQIIAGRTRSDGQFAFFPLAYGGPAAYTVSVETNFGSGEGQLGADFTEIQVNGTRPDLERVDVDVAFVIDATGSMSEEISRIRSTITSIADRISQTNGVASLRFGLVDYRDRGDEYVTHSVDFTDDIDAFRDIISQVRASGGGDFPEDLNSALRETMRRLQWRHENTLRMVFVVADAPAHHYEQAVYTYDQAMKDAAVMGIKIFPIASGGSDPTAEFQFRQLAQFSQGHFIFITEGGGSSSGSGGSEYHVDENQFRVERLDDLLVRLVGEEIQAWLAGIIALPL